MITPILLKRIHNIFPRGCLGPKARLGDLRPTSIYNEIVQLLRGDLA